ncbi:MAG TPA: hypothetical protein DEB40_10595 [Elusimicrobia bacterium]|nr:hypothetical protein [Elusimicrobiota bacterium]HBT62178.1 hypothetical protein [Elusimicrobiota bacterium]
MPSGAAGRTRLIVAVLYFLSCGTLPAPPAFAVVAKAVVRIPSAQTPISRPAAAEFFQTALDKLQGVAGLSLAPRLGARMTAAPLPGDAPSPLTPAAGIVAVPAEPLAVKAPPNEVRQTPDQEDVLPVGAGLRLQTQRLQDEAGAIREGHSVGSSAFDTPERVPVEAQAVDGSAASAGLSSRCSPRLLAGVKSELAETWPFLTFNQDWLASHSQDPRTLAKVRIAHALTWTLGMGAGAAVAAAFLPAFGIPVLAPAAMLAAGSLGTAAAHLVYNHLARPVLNRLFPSLALPLLTAPETELALETILPEEARDVIRRVLNRDIEMAAADSHNIGWKKAKDEALANPSDPFVGWAPQRIKVSGEIKAKSREELSRLTGIEISEEKYRAIRDSPEGKDITHPDYKPYPEMLRDQTDGGTYMAGKNALPLLVLSLYLSDFRTLETRTKAGLKRVLQGLLDGTDKAGIDELSRLMHMAFEGFVLGNGERGYDNTVAEMRQTGKTVTRKKRDDFLPFNDLHQDVQALDSYTLLPAAKWFIGALQSYDEAPPHAFYELLNMDPGRLNRMPILPAKAAIHWLRGKSMEFQERFQEALDELKKINQETAENTKLAASPEEAKRLKASSEQRRSAELWRLMESRGLGNLEADEISLVFCAFKDQGLFRDMVKLYDQAPSRTFKSSTVMREFLAVALHKIGELDRSQAVIESLNATRPSGEAYGILGKIEKLRDQAGDPDALRRSIEALEKGFLLDFEFYPGINLVYNMITAGMREGSFETIGQAEHICRMVHLSAMKAGGLESGDFWTLATILESSVILGWDQEVQQALPKVMSKASAEWEIQAPIENLERLRGQIAQAGDRWPQGAQKIRRLDAVIATLRQRLGSLHQKVSDAPAHARRATAAARKAAKLLDIGFSFGEIKSTALSGNVRFGGQTHEQMVNRWDFAVVRAILKHLGLGQADVGFAAFNEKIDELIRQRFDTQRVEYMNTQAHDEFDDFMHGFLDVMDVGSQADSRTNLMVDFWLGRGDCRQHAYVKQLFFDVWKTDQLNSLMRGAYEQLKSGRLDEHEKTMDKVKALGRLHMLVFDSVIWTPTAVVSKYHPVTKSVGGGISPSPTGVLTGVSTLAEDHTWNGLAEVDDVGNLTGFKRVDAFYQNVYRLGGGEGLVVDPKDIQDDGEIMVRDAFQTYNPKTGRLQWSALRLKPTSYAGSREKRSRPGWTNWDEYGQVRLRGVTIEDLPKTHDGAPDVSGFFDATMQDALSRFARRVRLENPMSVAALLRKALHELDIISATPPSVQAWEQDIRRILELGGIEPTAENMQAALGLLEVVGPGESPGRKAAPLEREYQLVLKSMVSPADPYGMAAIRVVAKAKARIASRAPRLEAWPELDGWIRDFLRPALAGREAGDEDVRRVKDSLTVRAPGPLKGRRYSLRVSVN